MIYLFDIPAASQLVRFCKQISAGWVFSTIDALSALVIGFYQFRGRVGNYIVFY